MRKIEEIEQQIRNLSDTELAEFRQWYAQFDAQIRDKKFDADVRDGKLDALGEKARRAHAQGKSTKI